ncbi:Mpo1 family 2-hydroxy fatty acid dioxygenase [Leptospira noguchii]|uniref:Mpo1 family 2-hydroxy fatty acid dioxygenase n=1 Tax=Leptospira noguchii TaxID=28182 RepID=UPI0002BD4FA8|nr:Mpo1-like protein [Leptospira noguchii]EMO26484.1 PF06127 family protein [Leptospira interrogans serovar Bataviae str. HAI135]EMI65054.1 PF06127 family protein [Leptospira noguchii str. Bonito]EMS83651.1 PF06127 family protein [Leptospira noguchii str. Cascata]EMS86762.1 PF06127 family protein [Leptospira noguchii str. Hook]UOG62035.1 DUF962 domain-containing protein [Leptospira noguchii]
MKSVETWLDEYGESHQNPINKNIHWICVPSIYFTVIGLLWAIPVPSVFLSVPYLNFATIALLLALVFYIRLSTTLAFGMLILSSLMMYLIVLLERTVLPIMIGNYSYGILELSVTIFVLAWVGQFIGHKIEGKKPSFFKDLQFLMIGPIWLLGFIYKKMKIAY